MSTASFVTYITGTTTDNKPLIGGVWKLWEQEGFPLESSYLLCAQKDMRIDWLEAMADASTTNNLPALMGHLEAFLPKHALDHIKAGFVHILRTGKTYDQILADKRKNADALIAAYSSLSP